MTEWWHLAQAVTVPLVIFYRMISRANIIVRCDKVVVTMNKFNIIIKVQILYSLFK